MDAARRAGKTFRHTISEPLYLRAWPLARKSRERIGQISAIADGHRGRRAAASASAAPGRRAFDADPASTRTNNPPPSGELPAADVLQAARIPPQIVAEKLRRIYFLDTRVVEYVAAPATTSWRTWVATNTWRGRL